MSIGKGDDQQGYGTGRLKNNGKNGMKHILYVLNLLNNTKSHYTLVSCTNKRNIVKRKYKIEFNVLLVS